MTTEQMGLAEYIEVEPRPTSACEYKSLPTGLYCRLYGRELHWTARAAQCPNYIEERYIAGRAVPSCVFCRRSVNPKLDPDFTIPVTENE